MVSLLYYSLQYSSDEQCYLFEVRVYLTLNICLIHHHHGRRRGNAGVHIRSTQVGIFPSVFKLSSLHLWVRTTESIRETNSDYKILVGKILAERLDGRITCAWEDDVKMDLSKVVFVGVN